MRYFLDTEFTECGPSKPIRLISIGIVAEDGRELYAESGEWNMAEANEWVQTNVLPHLRKEWQPLCTIAGMVKDFVGDDVPEFWGYYADYDWVVFAQLFGAMVNLPEGWPMYCKDIKQLADSLGNPELPKQESTEHNALNDARWNKIAYDFLTTKGGEFVAYEQVAELEAQNKALLDALKMADDHCIFAPVEIGDAIRVAIAAAKGE